MNYVELRKKITEMASEIQALESGEVLPPADELLARVDVFIANATATGRRMIELAAGEAVHSGQVPHDLGIFAARAPEQTVGLLAALAGKALKDQLRGHVEKIIAAAPGTITDAERESKLTHLRAELLSTERAEYNAVEEARDAGHEVEHRAEVDARVLLGIA